MNEKELKKRCRALAKAECANLFDGRCLDPDLVHGNEPKCEIFNDNFSIHDGGVICDYFLLYVLPRHPELCQLLWAEIDKPPEYLYGSSDDEQSMSTLHVKQCAMCGCSFLPGSNRSKYCQTCRKEKKRKDTAARMREYRARH